MKPLDVARGIYMCYQCSVHDGEIATAAADELQSTDHLRARSRPARQAPDARTSLRKDRPSGINERQNQARSARKAGPLMRSARAHRTEYMICGHSPVCLRSRHAQRFPPLERSACTVIGASVQETGSLSSAIRQRSRRRRSATASGSSS